MGKFLAWIVVGAVSVACASEKQSATDTSPATLRTDAALCSKGPAYAPDHEYPRDGVHVAGAAGCVARCDYEEFNRGPTTDALPSGACTNEGEHCELAAWRACACKGEVGDFSGYACNCTGGTWTCALLPNPGAGTCGVSCGNDASTD